MAYTIGEMIEKLQRIRMLHKDEIFLKQTEVRTGLPSGENEEIEDIYYDEKTKQIIIY